MTTSIKSHVEKILERIDGSKKEKEDLYEELSIHLQLSSEDWMKSGISKEEAEKRAIEDFGKSDIIGSQLQEAMYPLRKIILILLASLSLVYAYTIYLFELFVEGDAHFLWLFSSVGISSLLLLIALQVFPSIDRKSVVNSALILHAFIFSFGIAHSTILAAGAWVLVLTSIILIYRTTVIDYQFKQAKYKKLIKRFHLYNISIGIMIIGMTLFFLWAFLLFSESFQATMLLFLLPLTIWIVAYYWQMNLLYKEKVKSAIVISLLPFLMVASIIVFYVFNVVFGGMAS